MYSYKFQFIEAYNTLCKNRIYPLIQIHNSGTPFESVDFLDDQGVIVNIPYDIYKRIAIEVFQ